MEKEAYEPVITGLERAPEIIVPLVLEMPEALRKRRPSAGKWSAHEHVCHMGLVHPMAFERLRLMLEVEHPTIKPYNPDQEHSPDDLLAKDLEESLAAFVRDRAELVALLRSISASDWSRTADHPEYARYSIFVLFRHLVLHDMLHSYRVEELVLKKDWA